MSRIIYFFAQCLSLLPLGSLYVISDFLYLCFYYFIGYRRKVVQENLRFAFPEFSAEQLKVTEKKFYHHFCDVMLETIKLFSISKEELAKRCVLNPASIQMLNEYKAAGKSLVLVSGHCGNWEWVGSAYTIQAPYPLTVSFRPATNPDFDVITQKLRTRFGTHVISVNDVIREVLKSRNTLNSIGFISDQTPPKEYARWIDFMHRDAPVYTGAEKIAIKFKYPVLFIHIKYLRRGYYEISTEKITDAPESTTEGDITLWHTRMLEKDLREQPWNWLWSHKRWKHQRTSDF